MFNSSECKKHYPTCFLLYSTQKNKNERENVKAEEKEKKNEEGRRKEERGKEEEESS